MLVMYRGRTANGDQATSEKNARRAAYMQRTLLKWQVLIIAQTLLFFSYMNGFHALPSAATLRHGVLPKCVVA